MALVSPLCSQNRTMGKKNRRRQTKKDPRPSVEPTASAEEENGSSVPAFPPEDWRSAPHIAAHRKASFDMMYERNLQRCQSQPPLSDIMLIVGYSTKIEETIFNGASTKPMYDKAIELRTILPQVHSSPIAPLSKRSFRRWFDLLKQFNYYPVQYVVESLETLKAQGPEYRIILLEMIYIIVASRKNSKLELRLDPSIVDEYCEDGHLAQCMNNISKKEEEPFFIRSLAMVIRATLIASQEEAFTTAEACYRRRAVAFCLDALSSNESVLEEVDLLLLEGEGGILDELGWPSDVFSAILLDSTRILRRGAGPSMPAIIQSGKDNPQIIAELQTGEIDAFSTYFSLPGGLFCDRCGKLALAYDDDADFPYVLLMCSACRLAHYCSRECQAKAWEGGHRNCCKKYGRFFLGDRVIVQRLTGDDSTYNGWLAVVVAKEDGSKLIVVDVISDRYVSGDVTAVRRLSVQKKNLRHLRPVA